MNQLTLFDRVYPRTEFADTCSTKGMKGEVNPLARASDPITSHKAAERIQGTVTASPDAMPGSPQATRSTNDKQRTG